MLESKNMKMRSIEIAMYMAQNELLISELNNQIKNLEFKQSGLRQEKRDVDQSIRLLNMHSKEDL